jgi:exopolyphosphatase/guanosine-5'-triphosphate,3'-diphosphate pyrophosphatase
MNNASAGANDRGTAENSPAVPVAPSIPAPSIPSATPVPSGGSERGGVRPVAVIDVGTTSVRMAIAEINEAGGYRTLDNLSQSVSLGKDTFTRGRIAKTTIEDCVRVLRSYRRQLREYGVESQEQIRIVATSAVREAENRQAFLDRVYSATGLDVHALDEAEVSRITYLGVQPLLRADPELSAARAVVVEIGGGTTEVLVVQGGDVLYSHTYRLGSLRLRESMEAYNAPRARSRQIMKAQIELIVEEIAQHVIGPDQGAARNDGQESAAPVVLVALGGDVRLAASRLHPDTEGDALVPVKLSALEKFTDRMLGLSVDELVHKQHLTVPDAETLGPALLGYVLLAQRLGLSRLHVSDANLRDGLLQDMAAREAWLADFQEQVVRSAIDLGRKLHFDEKHALHVAKLSRELFRALADAHRLDPRYELILTLAAILHEVGLFIGTQGYHKHSLYLILYSELFGMSKQDLRLVALVTRYHRRSSPKPTHEMYMSLPRDHRIAVAVMASLLRVAIALDRSRSQRVDEIRLARERGRWVITVPQVEDLSLEQLALKQSGTLFEEAFGRPVMLRALPAVQ